MEACCATQECVNKPYDAAGVRARACEGWKLEWTEPGPELKVIHAVVPGPFEEPKVLKALPYTVVSKCGSCVAPHRRRLRNGIPDPWLEYLEHEARGDDEERKSARLVKRCIKMTDFVWHKKGIALLQGIPDPWRSELPCGCEIKKESNSKKNKSHDSEFASRRRSLRRRSAANEEESGRSSSAPEEKPLRHRNEEKSPRSAINEEFLRCRGSNKCGENTKRRSKNCAEQPIRRQTKSMENIVKNAMRCAAEPSKTAYVCYGGVVPACLRNCFFEEQQKRRSNRHEEKSTRRRSKGYDEVLIERSKTNCDEEVPTKRRNKNHEEESPKRRSRDYDKVITDCLKSCDKLAESRRKCRQERYKKSLSKNKDKEASPKLRETSSDHSSELSVEAPKKSGRRCDTKHKVEEGKTCTSPKKLRTRCSGFDKVKQRLQELENELKAKEAAKDLKLREMEQLSKLRRKAGKGRKRSGKAREKFDPHESVGKIKSAREASISPRENCRLTDDEYLDRAGRSRTNEEKDLRATKSITRCSSKKVARWLDEPTTHKIKLPKESSKSLKKTEVLHVATRNSREFKTPQTPLKSIRKDKRPVTVRPCTPQATSVQAARPSRSRSPCPRHVTYTDEPRPTCRTCSPYSPNHRRVSYEATSGSSSPRCRRHQASPADEPATPRSNLSIPRTPSTASPKESRESVRKFLDEINSRIEITRDALNSPCMKSVAVQPFREEATAKTWRCPGRELCPRMRERAGGDEGSELFVRRVRVGADVAGDADDAALAISKFNEGPVEDSDGSDRDAADEPAHLRRSYRGCSMADFKRRQREIEELFVESFSERDC